MLEPIESFVNKIIRPYHKRWQHDPAHIKFYNEDLFRSWCKEFNITGWHTKNVSWLKLLDVKSKSHDMTPREDHAALFKTGYGELIFTSQLYGKLSSESLVAIQKWCNDKKLKVVYMPEYSWYCPGGTVLLMYTRS